MLDASESVHQQIYIPAFQVLASFFQQDQIPQLLLFPVGPYLWKKLVQRVKTLQITPVRWLFSEGLCLLRADSRQFNKDAKIYLF